VIAVDTNILVYAHRKDSPFHGAAARHVVGLAEGRAPWAIPWPCLQEFLGVVTHPRVYVPPTPLSSALDQVDAWLEAPTLVLLSESEQYWASLRALLITSRVTGSRIHDARVAALCIQHGISELWSADRDFSRFAELTVVNPLTR
jgi:toxin-antitoxin system PIN domain toxin